MCIRDREKTCLFSKYFIFTNCIYTYYCTFVSMQVNVHFYQIFISGFLSLLHISSVCVLYKYRYFSLCSLIHNRYTTEEMYIGTPIFLLLHIPSFFCFCQYNYIEVSTFDFINTLPYFFS